MQHFFYIFIANNIFTRFLIHMNITMEKHATPHFTAKCVQIRDADWVCHKINKTFPHFSLSKHEARIIDFINKNKKLINPVFEPTNIIDAYEILEKIKKNKKNKSIYKKIRSIVKIINKFGDKRNFASSIMPNNLFKSLYSFENLKIGNCSEHAIVAELILKMNGIKNATCAGLYKGHKNSKFISNWTDLDHSICVFNKDGSKFRGNISKHTIFIDSWLNKAGFAKDMERYYSNEHSKLFKLDTNETFKYDECETVLLSKNQMKKIKNKYHPFIFKNKNRDFMQNNKQSGYKKLINFLLNI